MEEKLHEPAKISTTQSARPSGQTEGLAEEARSSERPEAEGKAWSLAGQGPVKGRAQSVCPKYDRERKLRPEERRGAQGHTRQVQGPRERHPQGEHWAAQGQTQKVQGPWEELLGEKRWAAQGQTQQAQGPWEELLGEKRCVKGRTQQAQGPGNPH